MNYFCDVHIQSGKNEEERIFIVLDKEKFSESESPKLTKEILLSNNQYKNFALKYKPKMVLADYKVYSTDEEIYASLQDNVFEELIGNEKVQHIGSSELNIDCSRDRASGRRKKKTSPVLKLSIAGGVLVLSVIAFGLGNLMGKSHSISESKVSEINTANEDGMIIPEQNIISENAEQITISIDRSYSAVPREDLQIKGEVVDGAAKITLPEFDKTDFFTHVAGYTWGFSTIPDGEKSSITAVLHMNFQRIQSFTVCL